VWDGELRLNFGGLGGRVFRYGYTDRGQTSMLLQLLNQTWSIYNSIYMCKKKQVI
jgi:hypothetical protein